MAIIVCFTDGQHHTSQDAPEDPVIIDRVNILPTTADDTVVVVVFHRED